MAAPRRVAVLIALLALLSACGRRTAESWIGTSTNVAPGIEFYRSADNSLVEGAGPLAVYLLRLDPRAVRLASALANDVVVDSEPVAAIAQRRGALAAINGGFFNRANGEPIGLLKVAGQLVSDSGAVKGVVIIGDDAGHPALTFDQLSAKVTMTCVADAGRWTVPIDGVDTTRERGRLMLYTPAYDRDTGTAPTGTEWVLDGDPLQVVDVRPSAGHTPIPPRGAVLSYGGTDLPPDLQKLVPGVRVTLTTTWRSLRGLPSGLLDRSDHIINGAGLLRRSGEVLKDWRSEALSKEGFTAVRHPRTIIGLDRDGFIWLGAIDGRQPDYSIGMTFSDLQRLADRLKLTDALNLDGGGSTTMVVRGQVVNRPSDPGGARPVADAIVVLPN